MTNLHLKLVLLTKGWTQRELARHARMRESRLSEVARGRRMPNARERDAIAAVLSMPPDQLFQPPTAA